MHIVIIDLFHQGRILRDRCFLQCPAVPFIPQFADRSVIDSTQQDGDFPVAAVCQIPDGPVRFCFVIDRHRRICIFIQRPETVGIRTADKRNIQNRDFVGCIVKLASEKDHTLQPLGPGQACSRRQLIFIG